MHFPRIAFSQRCLSRESRFYQRSFSRKKCISRRLGFFAISISAKSHFSDYPAGRQIALGSGEVRSVAATRRSRAAWWQQGFDREGGGVPISLAAAFRLERRWAPLKLVGITSSKKGDVRLLRLAAAPRVVVVMDLLGRRE